MIGTVKHIDSIEGGNHYDNLCRTKHPLTAHQTADQPGGSRRISGRDRTWKCYNRTKLREAQ